MSTDSTKWSKNLFFLLYILGKNRRIKHGTTIDFKGENKKRNEMNTITKRATKFLVTILSAIFILTACNSPVESNNNMYDEDISEMLKAMPVEEVNSTESEGLVFMRE